ncbi:HET-domain-containing protein [Hypoxylon sp. EC38]|nr:HET-domain-containing protein [Hypoxylon sp. EC38]
MNILGEQFSFVGMSESSRCARCSELTVADLVDDGYLVDDDALKFILEPTQEQVACDICSLIRDSFKYDHAKLLRYPIQKGDPALYLFRNPPCLSGERIHRIDVIAMPPRYRHGVWVGGKGRFWQFGPPDDKPHIVRGWINMHCSRDVHPNSPLTSTMKNRLPAVEASASESVKVASEWLDSCLMSRQHMCASNHLSKLPTRVIDVGLAQPRLIEPGGLRGKYAALSYCWGEIPFFKMTSTNRTLLMQSISLEELPLTIRDAIHFTKILGIQYLWVDSLCIIQGTDEEARQDWAQESQQMSTVFGNAFLTVSASGSTDAYQGLFRSRPGMEKHYCSIPASKSDSTPIFLGWHGRRIEPMNEPLSKRGWAFQENILSTRIFSFGSSELSWSCRGCVLRESLFESFPPRLGSSMSRKAEAKLIYTNWTDIVEKYSLTSLTLMSDRLAAIQGIINFVQTVNKEDTCVAGLWEKELKAQLLWKRIYQKESSQKSYDPCAARQAPSWSWASVDGLVKFLENRNVGEYYDEKLKRHRMTRVLFSSPSRITIYGGLKKFDTIRCTSRGRYNGIFEIYRPWRVFKSGMRTWIDDMDAIPEDQQKTSTGPNPRKEILNVWFLFLGKTKGLILIKKESQLPRVKRAFRLLALRRKIPGALDPAPPEFRRVGVFSGYVGVKYPDAVVTLV